MGAGSLLLYAPILVRLVRSRSADGLSEATWWLQLFGFTTVCIYNSAKGFPLAAYVETLSFAVQSGFILLAILLLQARPGRPALRQPHVLAGIAAYAALWAAAGAGLSPPLLACLQVAATVGITGALLPQLWMNAQRRSGGGWSPITAGLSAAGNAVRCWTTMQLTGDGILLAGFAAGFLVNAALLAQILLWSRVPDLAPVAA